MNPEKINNDLKNLANNAGLDLYGEEFANYLDKIDKLSNFRQLFCIPTLNQQSLFLFLKNLFFIDLILHFTLKMIITLSI